ncbi:MAG: metallophosphoesterase [Clostridia bacterium]|nr:metallophosphoesterase [Clostridia bacterium]
MRILVVSDTHGNVGALCRAIEQQPTAHAVIFLGDGLRDAWEAEKRYPERIFYTVPGNCDFGCHDPKIREETLGGKRFFFTHGHVFDVKYGLYRLDLAAREHKADIALFGHTHTPYEEYADGLYLFNPGSLGYGGTYGYVDVVGGGAVTQVVSLR